MDTWILTEVTRGRQETADLRRRQDATEAEIRAAQRSADKLQQQVDVHDKILHKAKDYAKIALLLGIVAANFGRDATLELLKHLLLGAAK